MPESGSGSARDGAHLRQDLASAAAVTIFTARGEAAAFIACNRLAGAILPPARLRALLDATGGSPVDILTLTAADLVRLGIGLTEKQAQRLYEAASAPVSPRLLDQAQTLGASVVTFRDPAYPANMDPLSDAPPLLFVRGALQPDDRFSVAVVGSRRASSYGRSQASRFAQAFVERGLCVVSGGAAGIDTFAHQGALAGHGRTIAVLGCGVDINYPAENRPLFDRIVEQGGALVSEFPLGTRPEPWRFPTRNRIIAGMAKATVVIETPDDSGALITARNAAEYGRDVWVVPGPVDSGRSRGGHKLVQDGAGLADSPADVLFGLGIAPADTPPPVQAPRPKDAVQTALSVDDAPPPAPASASAAPLPTGLTPDEAALLARLDLTPQHLDEASERAGLTAPQATVAATLLEMKSLIRRMPGNLFVRVL
jgi:DNA processing protein